MTRMRGFSLVELMVSLVIFAVLLATVVTFARDLFSARESVERSMELDTLRWYIRDSLDCRQTLKLASSTRLPAKCSDYPPGRLDDLIARPMAGRENGAKISSLMKETAWLLRAYCSEDSLVVEYRPKNPKGVDEARKLPPVAVSDVLVPRALNPEVLLAQPVTPTSLGFTYLNNVFASDKPEPCPPSSSLGSLMALANFAVNTTLNSMAVQNASMEDLQKEMNTAIASSTNAISNSFSGFSQQIASVPGLDALRSSVNETRNFAGQWLGNIAENALKKGGEAVMKGVVGSALSGKGIGDFNTWGQAFTTGALGSATGAIGAPQLGSNIATALRTGKWGIWEMAENAPTLDSTLHLGAKIPLKMFVAVTDINTQIEQRMQNATNIMVAGLQAGLPNNPMAQDAVKALWDLDSYLKNDAPQRFNQLADGLIGDPIKKAAGEQVDALKQQMVQKFDKMELDLKNGATDYSTKIQLQKALLSQRGLVLSQIEAARNQAYSAVNSMVGGIKNQFSLQMVAAANDSKTGIKAMISNYLKDLEAGKKVNSALLATAITKQVMKQIDAGFQKANTGNLIPPEPPWRDLFDGGSRLCQNEFTMDPMRDFDDKSNPCGVVMGGNYPVLTRTHNGRPICCREVSAVGKLARCGQNEVTWLGGAECSSPQEPITGQQVSRKEFLPVLQGQGLGVAVGMKTLPADGGGYGIKPPTPHVHNVQGGTGGGKVAAVLQVSKVYASTPKGLGGFLRASSPAPLSGERVDAQEGVCYWANKTYSRHGEYAQPHDVTTKALCCSIIGY